MSLKTEEPPANYGLQVIDDAVRRLSSSLRGENLLVKTSDGDAFTITSAMLELQAPSIYAFHTRSVIDLPWRSEVVQYALYWLYTDTVPRLPRSHLTLPYAPDPHASSSQAQRLYFDLYSFAMTYDLPRLQNHVVRALMKSYKSSPAKMTPSSAEYAWKLTAAGKTLVVPRKIVVTVVALALQNCDWDIADFASLAQEDGFIFEVVRALAFHHDEYTLEEWSHEVWNELVVEEKGASE